MSELVSRFPGRYNWLLGGAVNVGETYEDAAARHEAIIEESVAPDPAEIAWHDWLSESTLREVLQQWPFVPDCQEAFTKYTAHGAFPGAGPGSGRASMRCWVRKDPRGD